MTESPHGLDALSAGAKRPLPQRLRTPAKIMIAAVTPVLLLSMGAQFFAAPVLLPALWWAAQSSEAWGAAGFTFLAALLMTEVGWVIAYVTVRETQPWISLGPALGFVATIAVFWLARRRARRAAMTQ